MSRKLKDLPKWAQQSIEKWKRKYYNKDKELEDLKRSTKQAYDNLLADFVKLAEKTLAFIKASNESIPIDTTNAVKNIENQKHK